MLHRDKLNIRWHPGMGDVDRSQWDRLAQALETPLLEWQWLYQMESSGSICAAAGWRPSHLTVWRGEQLVGAAPLYIKTHSNGEFVYDHWWARWAREAGIAYYPKLVGMSPATPAVGYRFLLDGGEPARPLQKAMFAAIDDRCRELKLSGSHFLFADPQWMQTLDQPKYLPWQHQSFLWSNEGFASFEDYLSPFKSTQRRNIRREREYMRRMQIRIDALSGEQIKADLGRLMYDYYVNTNAQYGPWAAKYFNRAFFEGLFRDYRHRLLLMAASHPSRPEPLALSLLLRKGDQLIGRYWGAAGYVKHLHFNMCFYAPIEWAIANGVRLFDPGAGSPHKIYRGFKAVSNTSLHCFYDPKLRLLFQRFIRGINQVEQANIEAMNEMLPYAAVQQEAGQRPGSRQ